MTTAFPISLDNFTNPTASNDLNTPGVLHADQHANTNDAIEAIEAKLGINSSAVSTSLDYKVSALLEKGSYCANIVTYGAEIDGTTDDTAAVNAAIAAGFKHILIPYSAAGCRIDGPINISTGDDVVILEGVGAHQPVLLSKAGTFKHVVSVYNNTGVVFKNLKIDMANNTGGGSCVALNQTTFFRAYDCWFANGQQHNVTTIAGCSDLQFWDCKTTGSANSGIDLSDTTDVLVCNTYVNDNGGFGIFARDASKRITLFNCWSDTNTAEMFCSNWDSEEIRVYSCRPKGCGDNGLSLAGNGIIAVGNVSSGNANNGIAIYGKNFTVTGNTTFNNNQSAGNHVGISVEPAWGGLGSYGTVTGNNSYDTQAVPTQLYGVKLWPTQYTVFAAGQTVTVGYPYRTYGANLYRADAITGNTVTGATPPTHTTGTASDGTILWTYLDSQTASFDATGITAGNNHFMGNATAGFIDAAPNGRNQIAEVVMGSLGITTPANGTYALVAYAPYAGMINSIKALKTASGTLTGAVKINGTNVTSLSGLSVTSTPQNVTATGANTFVKGDRITFVVSSNSSGASLEATLEILRTM